MINALVVIVIFIIAITATGFLHGLFNKEEEDSVISNYKDNNNIITPAKEKEIMEDQTQNTLQLMMSTLQKIGCQPETNEDGSISVSFQGENFFIETGGAYVQIWDLGWASMTVIDPHLQEMRASINETNFHFGPTLVLTEPDKNDTMYIHSRMGVLMIPSIPDIENYLRASLCMFFEAKNNFNRHFNKLINERTTETQSNNNPVGFSSTDDNPINPN